MKHNLRVCGVWSNKFHNDVGGVNLGESEEWDESDERKSML